MFNNPLAKDLRVDINAGYLLQTGLRGEKHTPTWQAGLEKGVLSQFECTHCWSQYTGMKV